MPVAHSEALLAILDACADLNEELDRESAGHLLAGIAAALFWGPPALATNERLQAVANQCLGLIPQVGGLFQLGEGVK